MELVEEKGWSIFNGNVSGDEKVNYGGGGQRLDSNRLCDR